MSFFQDLFEGLTADYALKPEDFERASQASTRRPSSTDEENQGGDGGGNGSGNSGVSVKAIVQQIEERKWATAAQVTATALPAAAFASATLTSSSCSSSSSSVLEPPSSASASAPVPPPAGGAFDYATDGAVAEEDGASIFDSVLSGATGMVSSLLAGDFEWTHEKETKKEEAYFEEAGPSPLDDEEHWYAEQVKKGVSSLSSPLRAAETAAEVNLQEWTNPEAIASSSAELVRDAGRSSPSSTPRDVFTSATSSSATAVPSAGVPVGTTVPSSGSSSSSSSSTSALPTSLPSKPSRKRDFTMVSGSQFEAVMRIEKECYDRDATVAEEGT